MLRRRRGIAGYAAGFSLNRSQTSAHLPPCAPSFPAAEGAPCISGSRSYSFLQILQNGAQSPLVFIRRSSPAGSFIHCRICLLGSGWCRSSKKEALSGSFDLRTVTISSASTEAALRIASLVSASSLTRMARPPWLVLRNASRVQSRPFRCDQTLPRYWRPASGLISSGQSSRLRSCSREYPGR
ncbi:hypothetical protein DSECCO2_496180 [anaerobic digester metagenome]